MAHKEEAREAVLLQAVQLLRDALEENRSLRGLFSTPVRYRIGL